MTIGATPAFVIATGAFSAGYFWGLAALTIVELVL